MAEKAELTEQDISILKQALAIAVIAVEHAPPRFRPESQYDMHALLGRLVESDDELILSLEKAREIVGAVEG
jgi:hypothetical protein